MSWSHNAAALLKNNTFFKNMPITLMFGWLRGILIPTEEYYKEYLLSSNAPPKPHENKSLQKTNYVLSKRVYLIYFYS